MDMALLKMLLTKEGRINRSMFMAYLSVFSIVMYSFYILVYLLYEFVPKIILDITGALVLILLVVLTIPLLIKRSHDFDESGWFALMLFIPIINFMFFVTPGTTVQNKYGDIPPPSSILVKTLAILYFVWPVIILWMIVQASNV